MIFFISQVSPVPFVFGHYSILLVFIHTAHGVVREHSREGVGEYFSIIPISLCVCSEGCGSQGLTGRDGTSSNAGGTLLFFSFF